MCLGVSRLVVPSSHRSLQDNQCSLGLSACHAKSWVTVTIDCVSVALSLGQPPFAYLPVCLLANEPWRGFRKHTRTAPMQISCVESPRSFKAQSRLSLPTFLLQNWNCDPDRATEPGHSAVCASIVLKHSLFRWVFSLLTKVIFFHLLLLLVIAFGDI